MTTPQRYAEICALADNLIASSYGGRELWDEIETLTVEEGKVLDTMALRCISCDQWYASAEMQGNGFGDYVCEGCQ